jgi:proline iminopeptidase
VTTERFALIEPYDHGMLNVGDGHTMYWETVGNPSGEPVVFLHGGPGAGCSAGTRRWFDPARWRAVLFDQRGCGRSRPLADTSAADLTSNTTSHLISDIETLRGELGIERWAVVGVSWGSTLALAYAQTHPEQVTGMVLFAVTSGRRVETGWITRDMRRVFPREWDEFAAGVPDDERSGDLAAAYAKLLADPDPAVTERAAVAWCKWEDTHVSLAPDAEPYLQTWPAEERQVFARLVTHYWAHGCFLDHRPVLDNMDRLAAIPATLIHGRLDVSGPLDTAWDLHRRWPRSRLVVIDDAGHGGNTMTAAILAGIARLSHEGQPGTGA